MPQAKPNRRTNRSPTKAKRGKRSAAPANGSRKGSGKAGEKPVSKPEKLTGTDLETMLRDEYDIDAKTAHILVRDIMDTLRDALVKGRPVALFNIGTLRPYVKKGTTYKHPVTGEIATADDRVNVRLVLSPNMKDDLLSVTRSVLRKLKQC